jgi:CheY-like chemotaxis protein
MAEETIKVLHIDDEPYVLELVRLVLRKGFDVTGATGGPEGLEAMRRAKPDVVLLDLMMPGMSGWEVFQQMKADRELMDIPVIVLTAKAQGVDEGSAPGTAKVDGYITKPFRSQDLLQSIERVMSK